MPNKSERVTRADFNKLSKREILRSSLFDVAFLKGDTIKVGCVISKKRVKKAVERNKIRRKSYQAFKESGFTKPYTIIIYPRAEMLTSPLQEVVMEFSKVLATLK